VGLRAAHYFLSGAVDFIDQLDQTDAMVRREVNPFLTENAPQPGAGPRQAKDVWDDAFDLRVRIPENPNIVHPETLLRRESERSRQRTVQERDDGFRYFDTTALDTSPGGYRIRWNEPLPGAVQTGDFLAMRDANDPRWCVAIIRWIRLDAEGTTMGIELLAPRAIPVAIRVLNKRGGPSDYARGFLLPELKLINQPATLITPLMPFQSGQKIHIQRQGVQATAQLTQSVLRTESFNQFSFRMLDGYLENARLDLNMNNLAERIDAPSRDGSK